MVGSFSFQKLALRSKISDCLISCYPYNFPGRVHHYLLFTDEKTKTGRVWCHLPKVTQLTNIGLNIKSLVPTSTADSWIERT